MAEKLTGFGRLGYVSGMLGHSILINTISVMLIYFYLPPNNSGLTILIPQITFFGIFTVLSLIVASGRLLDAVTDPFIAFLSDKSKHRRGRRIPFMLWGMVPCVLFCILIFTPYELRLSSNNLWWLAVMQAGFYLSMTVYVVPYFALLPELAHTQKEKVFLSSLLSVGYVLGMIFASQIPFIADVFEELLGFKTRNGAMQASIISVATLAGVFMIIPTITVNEKKHISATPVTLPLRTSVKQTLKNKNFIVFVIADMLYFLSITIIVGGLLYYVTVLLGMEESIGGSVMAVMVLTSLLFYPICVKLSAKIGKKPLMLFTLIYLSILLAGIYFMGRLPVSPTVQIYTFAVLSSLPLAFLGILPFAIIADITEQDKRKTGQQKEAMYFAVRNLAIKFGQTFGIMIFAILTLFGKDPGNDFGIRLSGAIGSGLCILAAIALSKYKDIRE